jgi:aminopeptidase N
MRQAMHTYFMRYRFTHPTADDFLKTIEEVSEQNLCWYFDQVLYGTSVLDLRGAEHPFRSCRLVRKESAEKKKGGRLFIGTVLIQRKGDFILPVEVEVRFDNGDRVREKWDGRDRWVRFSYDKKAKIR